jgi:cytochrome P450/NADPH-cytochrome P450 reductase
LLNHTEVAARAYEEVDRVLGHDLSTRPTYAEVNQLTYITQILKETLRLFPTAPAYALVPYKDTVIGGRYKIKRHHQINVLLPMLHRDTAVWGAGGEVFNPDNFTPAREAALPPNAYKPFGNGQRACIGRQFALQEATLVIGMILQRFKLIDHTRYQLKIKETLTMKPDNFKIRIRLRRDDERSFFKKDSQARELAQAEISSKTEDQRPRTERHETPLLALYGSNMGTAEELARRIAEDAGENGFAVKVAPLDDYIGRLPKEGLVFITSSSYNGKPPDNAAQFCAWLDRDDLKTDSLNGVTYAVFGCGNRDWATTFQAVPRFIDERLAELGAKRFYRHGEGDARDDFEGQFQSWYQPLRSLVAEELKLKFEIKGLQKPFYKLEIVNAAQASPFVDSFAARPMRVVVNRELHRKEGDNPSTRSTRHIELELPLDVTYAAGDHLGVIPHNTETLVKRVAARFGFERDRFIRLRKTGSRKTFLPVDETISVYRLLSDYVELQETTTRTQINTLAEYTECPPEKIKLTAWTGEDEISAARYREEVFDRHVSLIDLLEEFPACALPFEVYLEMLSPLRPRYYSISSSPLASERACSITVAVVEGVARRGRGTFAGVCTNYLRRLREDNVIYAFVKDTKSVFRLPDNPATPIIMVGPGTGIAPFRGFLQERAALKAQGQEVGQSILFFGCRHPQQDFIYEDELRRFEEQGVTKLSTSFSRVEGQAKCYVQNEIYVRRDEVWGMLEAGAVIYVCGDASRMAPDVWRTFAAIYSEKTGASGAEAESWLHTMTAQNRYLVDVWSSS